MKEKHKGTWRNGTGLKQLCFVFFFFSPLLSGVKETRLPNGAENSRLEQQVLCGVGKEDGEEGRNLRWGTAVSK